MRVALISDIHGNDVALQAVLGDIARQGVDELICLGDVATLGPDPRAVLSTLCDLGCRCVVGNHDAFLLDPDLIGSYSTAPAVVESVDWCRAQLSEGDLAFLGTFEPTISLTLEGGAELLLFHGSPRSHMENILATTTAGQLDSMLAGQHAGVLAGGHTHIQMLRQHRGMLVVNAGSVGMPFEEFVNGREPRLLAHAEYAIVDARGGAIGVELRRVPLSRAALCAAAAASALPMRDMLIEQYS